MKNLNKMGQPLYLNSINPLLMWFLSSVKIKKYFQTIQHFAFESKMIFNLFPYCSCHSHGLSLSQYALLGITIKTNMSEFKHLSTGQCLNTSRHGVRAEGVYPLKGKKQFLKDSSLWQLRSLSLYWVTVFSHHNIRQRVGVTGEAKQWWDLGALNSTRVVMCIGR